MISVQWVYTNVILVYGIEYNMLRKLYNSHEHGSISVSAGRSVTMSSKIDVTISSKIDKELYVDEERSLG